MRGTKQKEMFEISDLKRREILHFRSVYSFVPQAEGGGGYSDIFMHTYRVGPGYFLGFKILNFNKKNFFWGGGGMKILWIFLGSSQNWTILRGHFYAF